MGVHLEIKHIYLEICFAGVCIEFDNREGTYLGSNFCGSALLFSTFSTLRCPTTESLIEATASAMRPKTQTCPRPLEPRRPMEPMATRRKAAPARAPRPRVVSPAAVLAPAAAAEGAVRGLLPGVERRSAAAAVGAVPARRVPTGARRFTSADCTNRPGEAAGPEIFV